MNMFVVSAGAYSGSRLCGSTREKAEATSIDQESPPGKFWEIWMTLYGEILEGDIRQLDYSSKYKPILQLDGGSFLLYVFGDNEQHAVKVANELRTQWLAENSA
jgi:hypothetical protein